MAKKVNDLTVSNAVPDIIIGGDAGANSFRSFTKTILTAFINSLIGARKNGITLTGLTGSTISHSDIATRNILQITIDDFPHNIGFAKPGSNATERKAANSVVFTDIVLTSDQTVTIIFE